MPNTHRRRDSTRQLRRVGGVYRVVEGGFVVQLRSATTEPAAVDRTGPGAVERLLMSVGGVPEARPGPARPGPAKSSADDGEHRLCAIHTNCLLLPLQNQLTSPCCLVLSRP